MNHVSALTSGYSNVEGPGEPGNTQAFPWIGRKSGCSNERLFLFMVIYNNFRISESNTEVDEGK